MATIKFKNHNPRYDFAIYFYHATWERKINGDGKTNYFFSWRKCDTSRSTWIVKVTAARTVIPDWMILWFGLKIQTWLTYRRSVQSRLCDVVSLHYFNVIPRLRTAIRDGIYLFICSILTFPTELFEFEYSVQGSLACYVILFHVFYVD